MDFNHDLGSIFNGVQTIDVTQLPPLGGTAGVLTVVGTGAIQIPSGTVAQRPTGVAGMVRFNSDATTLEFFDGTAWVNAGRQGTVTSVAVSGSTGLSVGGSPITTSGTITLTLGTELQGLSALAATGLVARTSAGAYAPRTITGTSGNIVITDGDGVNGNPTVNLAAISQGSGGSFVKVTLDGFGRVTANTAVVAGDITALVDSVYVNVAGDTMSGALNMGGNLITNLAAPVSGTDAVTKNYVDSVITGLSWKQAVRVATTAAGTFATGFEAGDVIDGVTLVAGDRILIKNQADQTENGIYIVQSSGAPIRADDANSGAELRGASVYVEEGTTNGDTGWSQTTNGTITIGTTPIVWAQFSGSGSYAAGAGLTLTGNTFSITAPIATTLGGTGLTSIGSANQVLGVNAGATGLEYKTLTAGTGINISHGAGAVTISNTGVTSVALSLPSIFSVSGSPVTTTGTLTGTLVNQNANLVFAGPTTGPAAAPTFRGLIYDDLPIKLYAENPSTPTAPSATGANAVAIGSGSSASAVGSYANGAGSSANVWGAKAFANGAFATAGDAQTLLLVLRNETTSATTTELFLDGAAQRVVLPNNSVMTFEITVAARRTDATGGAAGYRFLGVIRKDGTSASTTFTGTPSKVVIGETNVGWDANVVADTTNGSLRVNVNGEAGKTIRWVATCIVTVVTN